MTTRAKAKASKSNGGDIKSPKEVKTVLTDKEVNDLLKDGWKLLDSGRVHIDGYGLNCKTSFIMAKF